MFEQTFVTTQAKTRKPWTVALSVSLQCMMVAVLLLLPLLHTEVLRMPDPPQPRFFRTMLVQPPPRVIHAANAKGVAVPATRPVFVFAPARSIPLPSISAPSNDASSDNWALPLPATGNTLPGLTALPPRAIPEEKPAVRTRIIPTGPIRVSEGVQDASLLYGPRPPYPQLAKATRSQGIVKMEAIIAADGTIRNLRVISGPPLLVNAAREAVQQWRYRPTLLNGAAVEVLTEIDIDFKLTQ